jgi:predicted heme/steroid binding protein
MDESPHGEEVFEGYEVVGTLLEWNGWEFITL